MPFKARQLAGTVLVVALLIQMQIAVNGYASRRTKIAFTSPRDGNLEICVMDGDGRNHRRVTVNSARDEYPAWSPDGKKIAFVSNRNNVNKDRKQIWAIDADGKNPIRLTDGLVDSFPGLVARRHKNSVRHPRWDYCDGCGWEQQEGIF